MMINTLYLLNINMLAFLLSSCLHADVSVSLILHRDAWMHTQHISHSLSCVFYLMFLYIYLSSSHPHRERCLASWFRFIPSHTSSVPLLMHVFLMICVCVCLSVFLYHPFILLFIYNRLILIKFYMVRIEKPIYNRAAFCFRKIYLLKTNHFLHLCLESSVLIRFIMIYRRVKAGDFRHF